MSPTEQDLRRSLHLPDDDVVDMLTLLQDVDRRIIRRRRLRFGGAAVLVTMVAIAAPSAVGVLADRSSSSVVVAATPTSPTPTASRYRDPNAEANLAAIRRSASFRVRVPEYLGDSATLVGAMNMSGGPVDAIDLKWDVEGGRLHVWQTNLKSDEIGGGDPALLPGTDVMAGGVRWRRVVTVEHLVQYATRFSDGVLVAVDAPVELEEYLVGVLSQLQ